MTPGTTDNKTYKAEKAAGKKSKSVAKTNKRISDGRTDNAMRKSSKLGKAVNTAVAKDKASRKKKRDKISKSR